MRVIDRLNKLSQMYGKRLPIYFLIRRPWGRLIPDSTYLKIKFYMSLGKRLNLQKPVTFNEKMQWLKLNDRRNIYTTMVDKAAVKRYITDLIGGAYVIPLLGVWDTFEQIDFPSLPQQFVLKTTHGCGGMVICRDKSSLDINIAKKKLMRSFNDNYYWTGREWPYKNVKPKILAEEYMQNGDSENLSVYKIFNCSGIPTIIQVIQDDKTDNETIDYFDTDWNLLDLRQNYPNSIYHLPRPKTLMEMLELARVLSSGIPFVRTDFYEVNGKVYFSEFTFYSDDGFERFYPDLWDKRLGDLIDLSLAAKV